MADLKYTFEFDVSQALSNAKNLTELFKQLSEKLTSIGTREAVKATEAIDKFVLAFEKLKPEEIEKLSPAIEKAVKEFSKLEQVKFGDVRNFVENLRNSLQQLPQANSQIVTSLELVSSRMRDLAVHSGSARMVMTSLNYVIRDLPYGFIGIANNIDMLAQGFIELSKQTGGAVGALRALGSALMGPTGITFLVSAGISAITTYFLTHRKSVQDTILSYDELIKK
jgi:methyl-accepting chemotaxis protein